MASTTTKPKMMQANEACVICVGARPIEYQKRIVRDRHTGQAGGDRHPRASARRRRRPGPLLRLQAGREGGRADHEAVLDAPGCFREADD
jgi:hypothetical protein